MSAEPLFTTGDLIKFLRQNIDVVDPESGEVDVEDKLVMSDDELILYIRTVLTKDFSEFSCVEEVPISAVYPLKLLAQKELCLALAIRFAKDFDMTADNNNQLKEGQKFTHYMALADLFDRQYNKYVADGGAEGYTLTSYDVFIEKNYHTHRSYEKGVPPALFVGIGEVTKNSIEVTWRVEKLKRLLNYKVFVSKYPILDPFETNENQISKLARLVITISNPHQRSTRITGLVPNTEYYVAVIVREQNGLKGMKEVIVDTGGD